MTHRRRGVPPGILKENPLFPDKILGIIRLREAGRTLREIGEEYGMTSAGVFYIVRRWAEWARAQK